ncbi:hypothetical protein [Streptomyces lydicus]|uniref:hypothetical protein n=1 Tax=Streptomyces lydicus TaxID=47763 RepID=UPI00372202A7
MAEAASVDCNRNCLSKTTISRYFSGRSIAPGWFICWLHEKAQRRDDNEHVPALEELLSLQRSAKQPTSCDGCNKLIRELGRSAAELLKARSETWQLERALAACRDTSRQNVLAAGSRQHSSVHLPRVPPLPVPRYRRDRQAQLKDVDAAQYVAARVSALTSEQQHHEVAATLESARTGLTPAQTAALVVSLRRREINEAAETLLQGYARDMPSHDAMGLAHGLLGYGLSADAEAVLRTAIGSSPHPPAGSAPTGHET